MESPLGAQERDRYAKDGYLVREGVLPADDLRVLSNACEDVVADLEGCSTGRSLRMGSYVFEIEASRRTVIKWEAESRETLLGVEPVAHLHPDIERYAYDARLLEPTRALLEEDDVVLYTEKLNLKRAHVGGPIVLHQDYPYWADVADDASRIATAVVFLDAADRHNGCLEVAPGSHRGGLRQGKDGDDFGRFEMDAAGFDTRELRSLEVPAGSIVWLGPFLVHRSLPNRSALDRRALLYSYQPAGLRHSREFVPIGQG